MGIKVTDISAKKIFSIKEHYELASKTGASIITIGFSEQNRPILVLKKGSGKLKVLFTGRIHGNEPAPTEALLEFISENTFHNMEMNCIFLANPDGAALYEKLWLENPEPYWGNNFNDSRLNANKEDVNRDWLMLSQKETRAIQKFIFSLRPHFAVDFHEYYWSDKGYPPKNPMDDEDGFMATMTDAPFFGCDKFVQDLSEEVMNYLINILEKEFEWKIKPRHFVGEPNDKYKNPTVLGIYLALRGIPKLLVETWGVACSTLNLEKRIEFHKKAMGYILNWIRKNEIRLLDRPNFPTYIKIKNDDNNSNKIQDFIKILNMHNITYEWSKDNNIIHYSSLETGFIKTIYYLIFEKGNNNK